MSSKWKAACRVVSLLTIALTSANGKLSDPGKQCCEINDGCLPLGGDVLHLLMRIFIKRPIDFAPNCEADVRFFLNTRANPSSNDVMLRMSSTPADLEATTTFNASRVRTVFIIHGLMENGETITWMRKLRDALLAHGDWNVLRVDWRVAAFPPYTQASGNVKPIFLIFSITLWEKTFMLPRI